MSIGYSDWDITETSESGGSDKHNKGYFSTSQELNTAYPTANPGDYAIVGSTDTIWVWDETTNVWVDTDTKGQVSSVNGKTGEVVLDAQDVGAIYTAGKNVTITGADNKINSDQYPLFTVNSGNVNSSGEGDLIGTANYNNSDTVAYTIATSYPPTIDSNYICTYRGVLDPTKMSPLTTSDTFEFHFSLENPLSSLGSSNNNLIEVGFSKSLSHRMQGFSSNTPYCYITGIYNNSNNIHIKNSSTGTTVDTKWALPSQKTYFKFVYIAPNAELFYSYDKVTWTSIVIYNNISFSNTNPDWYAYIYVSNDVPTDIKDFSFILNGVTWKAIDRISLIQSLSYKVGDIYPSIVATNGQGTQFTVNEVEALDLSQATDGNYTAYVTPEGEIYANKGTVYVQPDEPTMTTDDVWFDTSVYPYKAVQSDGTTEFADVPFATFTIETQANGSVLLTNPQTLAYNRFQVTMAQISTINTALAGKQVDLTTLTGYDSTATQVLKNVAGILTWVTENP